jgi:hypothetical protein
LREAILRPKEGALGGRRQACAVQNDSAGSKERGVEAGQRKKEAEDRL